MTYVEEAIGITRAAMRVGLPVVISFTVETDGRLPSDRGSAVFSFVDPGRSSGRWYRDIDPGREGDDEYDASDDNGGDQGLPVGDIV